MGTPAPFSVELRTPPGGGTAIAALAHSCAYVGASGPEVADPTARLTSLLGLFPNGSTSSSICQQDVSGGLASIAQLVNRKLGTPCLAVRLADVDPVQAGPQVECFVEDVVGSTVTPLPACGPSPPPTCWSLETDLVNCALADHLKLIVTRAQLPDPATITRMRCLVE